MVKFCVCEKEKSTKRGIDKCAKMGRRERGERERGLWELKRGDWMIDRFVEVER